MKFATKFLNKWKPTLAAYAVLLAIVLFYVLIGVALSGCTNTVTPRTVTSSQASFDGNSQNSGLIGFDDQGNGILTIHAYQRYYELASSYGYKFSPKLDVYRDDDLQKTATNTYLIDAAHLEKFATMNRWKKQGVKP